MSTPLTRARAKLRAVHRLQNAPRLGREARACETNEEQSAAETGEAPNIERDHTTSLLQPKLQRASFSSGRGSFNRRSSLSDDEGEFEAHTEDPGYFAPMADLRAFSGLIFSSYLNILLLVVPLSFCSHYLNWSATWVFLTSFLSLIPLALLLGEVTEDLAIRFGDVIGGLLNATFGNVVELILSLAALQKGLYDVVSMSLIGSVLSNLLLVLGCCFLVGGSQYHSQSFNLKINKAMCSLLFLSCIALALPTAGKLFYDSETLSDKSLQSISHGTAILLIVIYGLYLFFTLKTHNGETQSSNGGNNGGSSGESSEKEEEPALSLSGAIAMLTGITVIVAFASEFLTGSIEAVSEQANISRPFLGLIVLPIAGNACEHITAVFVAAKDKMDLAIGVALGSSIQIAIFVLPFVVVAGWISGHHFSLALDPLAVLILTLAVIHADFVSSDGTSNWLLGVQLVFTYCLIGLLFFFKTST